MAYLVICATVGSGNAGNIAVYAIVTGEANKTGAISKIVDNNNFSIILNGLTLAITGNSYHTTAIKQL